MFPPWRTCLERGEEGLGTVPSRAEPCRGKEQPRHGGLSRAAAALAMEQGPAAAGAGMRYSAQLQVRAAAVPAGRRGSPESSRALASCLVLRSLLFFDCRG